VTVEDEGEPGRNDTFTIEITEARVDGGIIGEGGTLQSGNIQIHQEGPR